MNIQAALQPSFGCGTAAALAATGVAVAASGRNAVLFPRVSAPGATRPARQRVAAAPR